MHFRIYIQSPHPTQIIWVYSDIWVFISLHFRHLSDNMSHLGKWDKMIKLKAEYEYFCTWKVEKQQNITYYPNFTLCVSLNRLQWNKYALISNQWLREIGLVWTQILLRQTRVHSDFIQTIRAKSCWVRALFICIHSPVLILFTEKEVVAGAGHVALPGDRRFHCGNPIRYQHIKVKVKVFGDGSVKPQSSYTQKITEDMKIFLTWHSKVFSKARPLVSQWQRRDWEEEAVVRVRFFLFLLTGGGGLLLLYCWKCLVTLNAGTCRAACWRFGGCWDPRKPALPLHAGQDDGGGDGDCDGDDEAREYWSYTWYAWGKAWVTVIYWLWA